MKKMKINISGKIKTAWVFKEKLIIRCPLHKELTPSCVIQGARFHCFGCGQNGYISYEVIGKDKRT